ncbi:uncharacterized protein CC84DRAFT_1162172 [Paraphaeosphaeria sporulosa]|uniref:Uncharacterized protein n=1 Tax=Paraphaeosphaeria sporulosa TaxID=1460663 RepID=A0A177CN07_9PLEO|nr:uncharacterized protein CC84DRAFT_1162172 [Paraphaeosphaeria sporulosa]OAG08179.1 hypothetical protein CC84DRAFT_1162172 [Paraphaeosphaeria sporulosa]
MRLPVLLLRILFHSELFPPHHVRLPFPARRTVILKLHRRPERYAQSVAGGVG